MLRVMTILIILSLSQFLYAEEFELKPFRLKKLPPEKEQLDPLDSRKVMNFRKDIKRVRNTKDFFIGLKGGMQINFIKATGVGNRTNPKTVLGGLFIEYRIFDYLSIEADVFYQTKGFKSQGDKFVVQYLSVIPLVKYYPFKKYLFLSVGPSIHFKIKEILDNAGTAGVTQPIYRSFSYGLTAAIGGSIEIDPVVISLEVRYDHGLSKMAYEQNTGGPQLYSRDVQFLAGVGYMF